MEADRGKRSSISFADVFEKQNFPNVTSETFEACKPKMTEGTSFGILMVFGTSGHSEVGENFYKQMWEDKTR